MYIEKSSFVQARHKHDVQALHRHDIQARHRHDVHVYNDIDYVVPV